MAKRSTPTPPPSVRLSPPQMRTAISRFRRRIDELQAFDPETVFSPEDPRVKILEVSIEEALAAAFGQRTPEYDRYSSAAFLNRVPIYMDRETPRGEIVHALVQSKAEAIALLNQAVRSFEEKLAELAETASLDDLAPTTSPAASRDVFIVHGHDGPAKIEVA